LNENEEAREGTKGAAEETELCESAEYVQGITNRLIQNAVTQYYDPSGLTLKNRKDDPERVKDACQASITKVAGGK